LENRAKHRDYKLAASRFLANFKEKTHKYGAYQLKTGRSGDKKIFIHSTEKAVDDILDCINNPFSDLLSPKNQQELRELDKNDALKLKTY